MRYCFYFLAVKYPGLAFPLSIFARVLSVTSGLNFVPLPRNEQFRQKLFVRPRYVQGRGCKREYAARPRSAEFPNSAASLYREFATRIVAVRQDVMCRN